MRIVDKTKTRNKIKANISENNYLTPRSRLFTLLSSLRLLPHNLLSFGSLGTEINKSKSVAFATHSNYNFQTQEAKQYTENKPKRNYDYDFTSSNANSCELWTKRRHEIKQKRILAKTIT